MEAAATAKAAMKAPARAAVRVPSQVRTLNVIQDPATPSKPGPPVQPPSAPPVSEKKKRKRQPRKKKPAASSVAPIKTPASKAPQPPAKKSRPIAHQEAPEVDHQLAPLSIPGPSSAPRGPQQQHQRQPPHPPSRGLPTAGRPAAREPPKNITRREEAKTLNWKQRKAAGKQRQVEKPVVQSAVGWVDPRWMETAVAAAAANPPTLPAMIPLPPYPTRKTALSRLGPAQSSV